MKMDLYESPEYKQALAKLAEAAGIDPEYLHVEVLRIRMRDGERGLKAKREVIASKCCEKQHDHVLFLMETGYLIDDLRIHLDVEKCARCEDAINKVIEFDAEGFQKLLKERQKHRLETKANKVGKLTFFLISAIILGLFALKGVIFIIKMSRGS